jgi:hypothetical protein
MMVPEGIQNLPAAARNFSYLAVGMVKLNLLPSPSVLSTRTSPLDDRHSDTQGRRMIG